ncbi:hypothetical protein MKX01_033313 [Papaver californicum]|nr:hypothetical protein MKX01_033313 [Papaver californicum]
MNRFQGKFEVFYNNRWLVFVAAMWVQSVAGTGYLFGSISPVIKTSLNYNQKQIATLGVAKDLGDNIGFLAGTFCEVLPISGALFVGAIQNLVGYGWVWLIVTHRVPALPLWGMCILIFVGTNGETYFNTAALVSSVQNFPKSRGPVVGILKGFAGLGGAIMTQIYALIYDPDHAGIIFMVAVGPAMVVMALMFIVRPVGGHKQVRPSDASSFTFIYSVCLLSHYVIVIFTVILFILLVIPIVIPVSLTFFSSRRSPDEETLLPETPKQIPTSSSQDLSHEVIFSELEDEKSSEEETICVNGRKKRIAQLQAKIYKAAAAGAVRVKRQKGPHRGEDFTLMQALIKADFWLIFTSLLLGSGSGLTVIDNLGQISQSLGYDNPHIFVSMISIWNFLGRISGGYFSEIVVKDYAYPRPVSMAVAQVLMTIGHFFFAVGWPGAMHVGTLLIGLGYGAHWAIVPAAASELFGLKKFGALYNFLLLANPAGSLVFSGLIASYIYDSEAKKQAEMHSQLLHTSRGMFRRIADVILAADEPLKCEGSICFFLTSMIMSGLCIFAVVLSMILVHRTKVVYASLYGKSRT